MQTLGLTSRFFFTGLLLSALLYSLNMSLQEDRYRQEVVRIERIQETVECDLSSIYSYQGFLLDADIMRPKLPPKEEVQLPIYPGCEDVEEYEDRFFCSVKRFTHFIQSNLEYGPGVKDGIVFVRFVVMGGSGKMDHFEIVQSPGEANSREALRIFELLKERDVRWSPGKIKGEPKCMQLQVPVFFKGKKPSERFHAPGGNSRLLENNFHFAY